MIQLEEPQIHMVPARGKPFGRLKISELVKLFNNTVKSLHSKTEGWCHTCWGNPFQQRILRDVQSYRPTFDALAELDADALTFETCCSGLSRPADSLLRLRHGPRWHEPATDSVRAVRLTCDPVRNDSSQ